MVKERSDTIIYVERNWLRVHRIVWFNSPEFDKVRPVTCATKLPDL